MNKTIKRTAVLVTVLAIICSAVVYFAISSRIGATSTQKWAVERIRVEQSERPMPRLRVCYREQGVRGCCSIVECVYVDVTDDMIVTERAATADGSRLIRYVSTRAGVHFVPYNP
jgi:hypothetical protein